MPTVNRFADFHDEITAWRHDLHESPEILYDVHRTAAKVEEVPIMNSISNKKDFVFI